MRAFASLWAAHPNVKGDAPLAVAMKRILYMATGAALFAVLAFLLGALVTNWYAVHGARSDDDINDSVGIFLVLWPIFIAAGAYVGHRLHARSLR